MLSKMANVITSYRRLIISLALLASTGAFLLLTILNRKLMQECFHRGSYFIILVLSFFWLLVVYWASLESKDRLKSFARTYGPGILFSILIAAMIFVSCPPQYRVLADETNLIGTSRAMTYEHRTDGYLEGAWFYQNFFGDSASRSMPTRPFLFPFFMHLVSVALGYYPSNAFVVNFIALAALFSIAFVLMRQYFANAWWAYAGVFLIASQPAITLTATSAAFDLVAALFLVVCFACLKWYLENPSLIRFQLLWINLIMLANTRYESGVYFAIAILLLGLTRSLNFRHFGSSYVFSLTPFFLLPLIWQRILIPWHPFDNPPGVAPFSLAHLARNSTVFVKDLFSVALNAPYANLVNILGILSILFFGLLLLRRRWATRKEERVLLAFAVLCVCAHWLITLSFFDAHIDLATNGRKYVLPCLALSVLALMLIRKIPPFTSQRHLGVFFAVSMFVLYHPFAMENRYSNALTLTREYRSCLDFLHKQGNKNFLLIADRPGLYTVQDYGAMSFKSANEKKDEVLRNLQRHLYDVLVIQEILYDGSKPSDATTLDPSYKLQSVYELQNTATSFIRISKVIPTQ